MGLLSRSPALDAGRPSTYWIANMRFVGRGGPGFDAFEISFRAGSDRLRESRLIVQHALEDRLRDTVEGTLGRRAIAVMSAIDVDRDVRAEILTLEPRAGASAV
jgi:hypothetical protein